MKEVTVPMDISAFDNSTEFKKSQLSDIKPSVLPVEFDEDVSIFQSSLAFGNLIEKKGTALNQEDRFHVMDLMDGIFKNRDFKDRFYLTKPWPDSLFVPGKDKNAYFPFFEKAPDSRLYSREWVSNANSILKASAFNGTLSAYNAANALTRNSIAEAGIGIVYTPRDILSVISFEPEVECKTTWRLQAEFNSSIGDSSPDPTPHLPVIVNATVTGSVITAAWELSPIPNVAPELVPNSVKFHRLFTGTQSGLGNMALQVNSKNLSGKQMASSILLQQGRTYLLGVIARVFVDAVVTDDFGRPYPDLNALRFVCYGTVDCNVPQMSAIVKTVYQRGIHFSDYLDPNAHIFGK